MKTNKRSVIFIDGNNFYYKLKEVCNSLEGSYSLLGFDYTAFAKWLSMNDELKQVRYYIGAIKRQKNNEKSEKLFANQQKLFAKLQDHKVVHVLGQLIQHPDGSYHEKGVDVRLAVEMIRLAREDVYDRAYLISSDTDLVAAIEEVKSFEKEVCYVGFSKGQSFGLTKAADDVRLLRGDDLEGFIPKLLIS